VSEGRPDESIPAAEHEPAGTEAVADSEEVAETAAASEPAGPPDGDDTGADQPATATEPDLGAVVASLTDDLKRLQAEYVNYKRRVDRDRSLVLENARFAVLSALLPVLDDVDRAREHGELEGGFKAVAESLERIVAGQGLVKFGKPGDEFDPRFHDALMHAHSPEVTTTTCQHVVSAGYQIGDRVVRPAKVTVVDPEPAAPAEPEAVDDTVADAQPTADIAEGNTDER
jgi:molecular chaperone GrpE